jgi:hypothetical protein
MCPSVNKKGYDARDRTPLHLGGSTYREGIREPSTKPQFDGRQHEGKRSETPPAREVDGGKMTKVAWRAGDQDLGQGSWLVNANCNRK